MVANYGKPSRSGGLKLFAAVLVGVFAAGLFNPASAQQTSMEKHRARVGNSPFNLNAGPNAALQANLVQCGIDYEGNVCTNIFNSPTGGGGFWPTGTTNQYIFNSGLQIAGINGGDAGPWARDTVGAYFFDARGTQPHGASLSDVYNSLNPADVASWPDAAIARDTSLFNPDLVGPNGIVSVSDQDSWVQYWDGDPNRISGRSHPMGIRVEQRSMAFNAPSGAEHTIFFIYKFTNVTNDPAFQIPNEDKFKVQLPDAGWTIDNIYAAFAMDPDITSVPTANFSTGILPFNMGVAYEGDFATGDFNFAARSDLYAPPFFVGPGFVGVKYLKSPIDPTTGREVGLTLFSNTTNGGTFPDPQGVKQLFRYLKGDVSSAAGDPTCTIPNSIQRRLCALVQDPADTRFFQASGPFSLPAGQSAVIVVAYTHAAPVLAPGYTPGTVVRPGIPSVTPGVGPDTIRTVERIAGLIRIPADAVATDASGATFIDESKLRVGRDVVPGSVIANGIVARTIFENKFLLPRPPESPVASLVPGNNQVTVVWQPSATEEAGDPYYAIASDPNSPLYNPNYRKFDVEGYRIYRATGLSGGFEMIAQFDKTGTSFIDYTGELDPEFVPEEGTPYAGPVEHDLVGDIKQFYVGGRIRDAVTGAVIETRSESITLEDTGVPFAFVDRSVRNGVTYRYVVTAFDVNSLLSGAISLESPRTAQFVTPRAEPTNMALAAFTSELNGDDGQPLDPNAPVPTIDPETGVFSGPSPATNGIEATFGPLVQRLLPAFTLTATVDSIVADGTGSCQVGTNWQGVCWRMYLTYDRDGTKTSSSTVGFTPVWGTSGTGEPATTTFPLGGAPVPADPAGAEQFGLPPNFPGFIASLSGTFGPHLFQSGTEGQYNRRIGACNAAGIACDSVMHGGSRWFNGTAETAPDPTTYVRHGQLTGVDTIVSFVNHTPRAAGSTAISPMSTALQTFAYAMHPYWRAADVQITWGDGGAVTSVRDVTHNVDVPFSTTSRASWGFLNTDQNGNAMIDWDDFMYLETVRDLCGVNGFCAGSGLGTVDGDEPAAVLENVARLVDISTQDTQVPGVTSTGKGVALYINGERYVFQMAQLPASGTVWTLRTYAGEVRTASSTGLDATGYTFEPALRPPTVPGLKVTFSSERASALEGEPDLKRIHTVPDPYYVRSAFELGPSNKALRFVNLPNKAIIRIYSLNGTLVRVLSHDDPLGGAETQWDLRNRNNQFVASGVYFYVVETESGKTHTGKFTVVQFAR